MGAPARARYVVWSCFVAHELVGITQAFAIDDAVVADRDGVFQRGAEREPSCPQPLNVLHEAEGPGAGQLATERAGIDVDLDALGADQRGLEVNLDVEMEAVIGGQFTNRAGILDANRLEDLEEAPRRLQFGQADLVDRLH
jgi:hypothetical protein